MFKLSIKPVWIGGGVLLAALAVAVKLAFAVAQFTPSASPIGYVAQDDVTNFNLKSGKEAVFRVNYERQFWSGNLFAYLSSPKGQLGLSSSYCLTTRRNVLGAICERVSSPVSMHNR